MKLWDKFRNTLISKLIIAVGMTFLISIIVWAFINIKYQKEKIIEQIVIGANRLGNTIRLGTHYAMMLNSRDDINSIINNIGQQKEIVNIRIYNKKGQIKFSNQVADVDQYTNIKAEACDICHYSDPPLTELALDKRKRFFLSPDGYRQLGIISPIYNEKSCSTDCHVHSPDKKVLGALDVVLSLQDTDQEIIYLEKNVIGFAVFVSFITSAVILFIMLRFVNRPIRTLINGTQRIAEGEYFFQVQIKNKDEMGRLAKAVNQMGQKIGENQKELKMQRDQYQSLFELVPCDIAVQDREFKIISFNRQFAEKFNPEPGDFCYKAYKGRKEKCPDCPVQKTFDDGRPHFGEETGYNKDGTVAHWVFVTAPIKNAQGEIKAAMEMSLDVTHLKLLEEQLERSEKKYRAIFNNIPNPVFVLDMDTLFVRDCNKSVKDVYGYLKDEIIQRPFTDLFADGVQSEIAEKIKSSTVMDRVRHLHKEKRIIYVNIRISPSEYGNRRVFLVTTSDITKRLEGEQQIIHASKMATLGEMATGVAHELNQPLSVIKTASSFFMKKIRKEEPIADDILLVMSTEIDDHVNRATNIINHLREFGRKADPDLEPISVNTVLQKAYEIFSQQLKLRGIAVIWDLAEDLAAVMAIPGPLEQVFINLLINARDSIEEAGQKFAPEKSGLSLDREKCIYIRTFLKNKQVVIEVEDTGNGIPADIIDKIFEPFYTTKEVGKGTGLGLSISYGIVKDCGGMIEAKAGMTSGACFVITFPTAA